MTFTLLIYRTGAGDDLPASVHEDGLKRHRALQAQAGDGLLVVARLDAERTATAFRHDGERMPTTDGPFMEAKGWLVGFYLLECASEAEAHAHARQICTPDHAIEVRPVVWHAVP